MLCTMSKDGLMALWSGLFSLKCELSSDKEVQEHSLKLDALPESLQNCLAVTASVNCCNEKIT